MYDITGSLCVNNDKFALDSQFPEIEIGDVQLIRQSEALANYYATLDIAGGLSHAN